MDSIMFDDIEGSCLRQRLYDAIHKAANDAGVSPAAVLAQVKQRHEAINGVMQSTIIDTAKLPGFYVAPSKIHGQGVFAAELIKKGSILFVSFVRKGNSSLNPSGDSDFASLFVELFPNTYVNHSLQPNTENKFRSNMYMAQSALRDIYPNEEIVSNYRETVAEIRRKGFDIPKEYMRLGQ